jgi:hypothetical protein
MAPRGSRRLRPEQSWTKVMDDYHEGDDTNGYDNDNSEKATGPVCYFYNELTGESAWELPEGACLMSEAVLTEFDAEKEVSC